MLIAGNWKMFRGPDPAALVGLDAVLCPPFTRLRNCVGSGRSWEELVEDHYLLLIFWRPPELVGPPPDAIVDGALRYRSTAR